MTKFVNARLTKFVQWRLPKFSKDRISVKMAEQVVGGQWSAVRKNAGLTTDH